MRYVLTACLLLALAACAAPRGAGFSGSGPTATRALVAEDAALPVYEAAGWVVRRSGARRDRQAAAEVALALGEVLGPGVPLATSDGRGYGYVARLGRSDLGVVHRFDDFGGAAPADERARRVGAAVARRAGCRPEGAPILVMPAGRLDGVVQPMVC